MRRRGRVAVLLAAAALAGCGGGESAEDVLAETAENLGEIRSGTLDVRLVVEPRGEGDPFGFELRGPFSLRDAGSLPVLDVAYTQIANGQRATVNLVSTGENAYARVGDRTVELTDRQEQDLRSATRGLGDDGEGAAELPLDDWIVDPERSDGDDVAGAETDRVTGKLDPVAVVNGLSGLARSFGRDVPRIEGQNAEQLRRGTRATSFELVTGKEDRLLRRLRMEADFAFTPPEELRRALGELVGAKVTFELGVTNPNEPVEVPNSE